MLELAPNLGKNERGEFKQWLVYYRVQSAPNSNTCSWQLDNETYLNYLVFPWIWRGTPDIQTFDAIHALGGMKNLPHPWSYWDEHRKLHFSFFTEKRFEEIVPAHHPYKWVLATDVSGPAVMAAIRRKEIGKHESIGPAEVRTQVVQVG